MIVTTVLLVRTTSVTDTPTFTTASQPVPSACAESRPSMMFCRSALNAAPPASQVSFVSVMTTVRPPATIWDSFAAAVIVPVMAALTTCTLKVGLATIAAPPATAAAGTVTMIVSAALMS